MGWQLAPSLVRLRNELNTRWPNRDKASDGTIGDAAHAASKSDHNPNQRGMVDAMDIDDDGIDPYVVIANLIAHPSTNYVIYDRKIWRRKNGFRPETYTGSDPHTSHIHESILQTSTAEQSTQPWGLAVTVTTPTLIRNLRRGDKGSDVRMAQQRFRDRGWRIGVDGDFGPETDRVVRAFQAEKGLQVDGVIGPWTWYSMWHAPVT